MGTCKRTASRPVQIATLTTTLLSDVTKQRRISGHTQIGGSGAVCQI